MALSEPTSAPWSADGLIVTQIGPRPHLAPHPMNANPIRTRMDIYLTMDLKKHEAGEYKRGKEQHQPR